VIPALIVPVLTDHDTLYRMLESVDEWVDDLVVIDNGNTISRFKITALNRKNIGRRHVWRMPNNLGVATSWNLGIKALPFAEWWLVCNFDVVWPVGALREFASAARRDALVLSGGTPPWCAFAIGDHVVDRVGLFDEGLHPAYWEDIDYQRRCEAAGVEVVRSGVRVEHANSTTLQQGYHGLNARTFPENAARAQARAAAQDMTSGEWSLEARRRLSWD
jgi:GT2 family glycosyltransferase